MKKEEAQKKAQNSTPVRVSTANHEKLTALAAKIPFSASQFVDSVLEDVFQCVEDGKPYTPRVVKILNALKK